MDDRLQALTERIARLAWETPSAGLVPCRYFVAGSGVITLGFRGFTAGLLRLKEQLSPGLPPEDPGSLWPKITLAALEDDQTLTQEEIGLLRAATSRADSLLAAEPVYVHIDSLAVVAYRNRSLTGRGLRINVPLGPGLETQIPASHADFVARVLEQWGTDANPGYLERIKTPGHRRSHYESPCDGLGTLVAFIEQEIPGLADLKEHISRVLPGRYHWFDPDGRHMTLRTLGELVPAQALRQPGGSHIPAQSQ